MIKPNKLIIVIAALAFFILMLLTVLINLPIRLFLTDSMESLNYTDLEGAT